MKKYSRLKQDKEQGGSEKGQYGDCEMMETCGVDIERAVEFLEARVKFWKFPELLTHVYTGKEPIQDRLVSKLLEYETEKKSTQESMTRKVRNWLRNRNRPKNREELFKICFALGLSESAAEHILGITAENGIHYRNPKELIYAFCLRKGLDYPEARRMIEEYWQNPFPDGRLEYQKQIRETSDSEQKSRKTIIVKNKFKNIRTQEELRQFIQENRENFGVHHNTAYRKFVKMLERLMYCESDGQVEVEEKEYGIERVVNEYLRMEVPYDKKSKGYTWLQKEIKRYWPTPKMIQNMYRRKEDVNRKTLILLYLATEGMGPDKEGDWKSQVKEHYRRINLMLSGCGMALLNLHSPFDYLVMQAIHKENEEEFMVTRMEGMLGRLFRKDRMAAYVGRREKKNTACKTESREK